jgi:hypothetical protein
MRRLFSLFLWTFIPAVYAEPASILRVTSEGKKVAEVLDRMDVKNHWKANIQVYWKTGRPSGKEKGPRTHCSAFVSAACLKLGVPMLNPPPQTLLANRQQTWLLDEGKKKGWKQIKDGLTAQELANQGTIVVASYRNPNAKKPGHIAMIRPEEVSPGSIAKKGPRICQAGGTNYNSTDLATGFANHPGAFAKKEILFFAYQPAKDKPCSQPAYRGDGG